MLLVLRLTARSLTSLLSCSLAGQRYKVPTTVQTQTRVAQFAGCYTCTHSFEATTCRKFGSAPKDYQHSTKLLPVNLQTICFSLGILQQTKRKRSLLQDGERNNRKKRMKNESESPKTRLRSTTTPPRSCEADVRADGWHEVFLFLCEIMFPIPPFWRTAKAP